MTDDSSVSSVSVVDSAELEQICEEVECNESLPKGYNGKWQRGAYSVKPVEEPHWITSSLVYMAFCIMLFFANVAEWVRSKGFFCYSSLPKELEKQKDFVPLNNNFEALYVNNFYRIASDVVNRIICGVPSSQVNLKQRVTHDYGWSYEFTGKEQEVINLGSYNYLGFSHNDGPCAEAAAETLDRHGLASASTRHEVGNHSKAREMERCVARYLGVEDAICFPMGFGTNSMNIPSLMDKNGLILSDELNHASLVLGCRLSGAAIKVFKHNDFADCEKKLRDALCKPSPKTGEKYSKVLIVIEGIYSMEGTIVNLPEFVRIKKKYGAYLFLDEAHSVGALGPSGKGVAEYWGVDPHDVDMMMGTLTKSFAAAGGYIGGAKATIDHIRLHSVGACYGAAMSPPVMQQVLASMKMMLGEDGTDVGATKAANLLRNSRYFRKRLRQAGFLVYGHDDSPVVPLMTFFVTKVVYCGRETLKHNVGVVSVGFPATPLTKARVRFCMSADHTKQQLDRVLEVMDVIGDDAGIKYGTPEFVGETIVY